MRVASKTKRIATLGDKVEKILLVAENLSYPTVLLFFSEQGYYTSFKKKDLRNIIF